MLATNLSYLVVGIFCTLAGTGVLYFSWYSKVYLKESFTILGWSSLVMALFCWVELSGWEFGLLYAITLPTLSALIYVGFNAELNNSSVSSPEYKLILLPSGRLVLSFLGKLILVLPFALTASILASYGSSILLVQSELNQMIMAICILPIIWGLFAYWLLADTKIFRPIVAQVCLSGLFLIPVLQV